MDTSVNLHDSQPGVARAIRLSTSRWCHTASRTRVGVVAVAGLLAVVLLLLSLIVLMTTRLQPSEGDIRHGKVDGRWVVFGNVDCVQSAHDMDPNPDLIPYLRDRVPGTAACTCVSGKADFRKNYLAPDDDDLADVLSDWYKNNNSPFLEAGRVICMPWRRVSGQTQEGR